MAFVTDPSLDEDTLKTRLKAVGGGHGPKVIQCSEGWCIIRSDPKNRDRSIEQMTVADPMCRSLRTSGTLHTLRDRYPELKRLRPPPKYR